MKSKGTLVIDLDGTICPIKSENEKYENLEPYKNVVEKIKEYKENGFKIMIFTARNMRTYENNLGLINVHTSRITMDWLDKHGILYDEVVFAKPWPGKEGFYIDDRAIRPDEFLKYSKDELDKIMNESRKNIVKG